MDPLFSLHLRTLACHEHLTRSVSNEINLAWGVEGGGRSNHVPLFLGNKLLPEFQTPDPEQ